MLAAFHNEVMGAVPGSDLLRPRSDKDVHVGSGIQFPFSTVCNHRFGVHDPCGIHNTWLSLFSIGLSSFEMVMSQKLIGFLIHFSNLYYNMNAD